jgi:NADH:ubiquinone oxidoreductase subunit F (NADH-binding)
MVSDIIVKLKKSKLLGRGGAAFPVGIKWEMVKKAEGEVKYVICNASEGEPGVKKDYAILKHYPERVVYGMIVAMKYLKSKKGIIYLNPDYYGLFSKKLKEIIGDFPIQIYKKPKIAGYVGGVDTTLINVLENKRIEPRLKPPYPTTKGLFNCPTLINNVETFYCVSLIHDNKYDNKRFYTIHGSSLHSGVYELPIDWTIEKILVETRNYPLYDFFVQVGGDSSGEVLNKNQLKKQVSGSGSIKVYNLERHKPIKQMKKWIKFFSKESCGQCTTCREGTYRLKEIIYSKNPDWGLFIDLINSLDKTSFCGLGSAVPIPIKSYLKNILPILPKKRLNSIRNINILLNEIHKIK